MLCLTCKGLGVHFVEPDLVELIFKVYLTFEVGVSIIETCSHLSVAQSTEHLTNHLFGMDVLYRCYLLYSTHGPMLCGSSLSKLHEYASVRAHTC